MEDIRSGIGLLIILLVSNMCSIISFLLLVITLNKTFVVVAVDGTLRNFDLEMIVL